MPDDNNNSPTKFGIVLNWQDLQRIVAWCIPVLLMLIGFYTALDQRIGQLEEIVRDNSSYTWNALHMTEFAHQMQVNNPTIKVPVIMGIVQTVEWPPRTRSRDESK